jgi:5-methylcytosine-specific restriction endonuclease McrA
MLREIKDGALVRHRLTLLGWRWRFEHGGTVHGAAWSTRTVRAIEAAQREQPVRIARDGRRCTWLFEGRCYREDDALSQRDVLALIRERERRARRRLQRAHAALARDGAEPATRREPIAAEVRRAVFERDGGRCVACGSAFDIQYDHVIPLSMGGAGTVENLQVLCATCNRRKGASLG